MAPGGLMDTLMYLADLSSAQAKMSMRKSGVVTQAMLERQEWDAFKAKIRRREALVGVGVSGAGALEEDDVDLFLAAIDVLERSQVPLTPTEVCRTLQHDGFLSTEFLAAARQQTQRLLENLRLMNRAYMDAQGRWGLTVAKLR